MIVTYGAAQLQNPIDSATCILVDVNKRTLPAFIRTNGTGFLNSLSIWRRLNVGQRSALTATHMIQELITITCRIEADRINRIEEWTLQTGETPLGWASLYLYAQSSEFKRNKNPCEYTTLIRDTKQNTYWHIPPNFSFGSSARFL